MAFQQVTVENRVSEFPNRRTLTKEDNTTEIVTVTRNEGNVSAEGTAWGAVYANDLESRINTETNLLETNFGHVETNTTASKSYSVGETLVLNGQMYKVTAAIAQGATLTVGTNIAVHSVSAINSNLTANSTPFYYDYQNSKYGYNTDPARGADTFHPFKAAPVVHSAASSLNTVTVEIGKEYIISAAIVSGYSIISMSLSNCTIISSTSIVQSNAINNINAWLKTFYVKATGATLTLSWSVAAGGASSTFQAITCLEL